jgi:hypothetical protein
MVVKKLYVDSRNRLRVEVRLWRAKTPDHVRNFLADKHMDMREWTVLRCDSYCTVDIVNISKKTIGGVTVLFKDALMQPFCQIDDAAELIRVQKNVPVNVGDIRPRRARGPTHLVNR